MIRRMHGGRTPVMALLTTDAGRAAACPTLDRWFADQGAPLRFDLARSGAASVTVAELLELTGGSAEDLLATSLDYGAGEGQPRLAAAVRASLGGAAGAGVVISNGAVEALLLLAIARGGRGEALVGGPSYGGLLSAPAAAGLQVRAVSVWNPVRGLHLDALAGEISEATALVIVNSPHNPSGAVASLGELDVLADRCERHHALLVVDEVARGTLDPGTLSAVHSRGFARGTTVVIGDVSKSLGLGGLRIGWLVTADAALCAAVAAAKDGTTVASSTLSEHLAADALEHAPRLLARVRTAARGNLAALCEVIGSNGDGDRWRPPADGLVAFPALSTRRGVDDLVATLRAREVGVVPGSIFGEPGRMRLGLGCAAAEFSEALERLGEALAAR